MGVCLLLVYGGQHVFCAIHSESEVVDVGNVEIDFQLAVHSHHSHRVIKKGCLRVGNSPWCCFVV